MWNYLKYAFIDINCDIYRIDNNDITQSIFVLYFSIKVNWMLNLWSLFFIDGHTGNLIT